MNKDLKRAIPILLLGCFFILFGLFIYYNEIFAIKGKHSSKEMIYNGSESIKWALSIFFFGLSFIGVIFKKSIMIWWLSLGMIVAVLCPLFMK